MPIYETKEEGLIILTPDPERVRASRIVTNIFPRHAKISYKVSLYKDFLNTVGLFYGSMAGMGDIGDILSTMGDDEEDIDRKSTRLKSSHQCATSMPSIS